jgi:tetratricopeptide (TPR) repeat protein
MFGKFPICSAAIISLVLIFTAAYPKDGETPAEGTVKSDLRVNGYQFTALGPNEIKGLREKAKADYYFYQGKLADVIRHYELASKYLPNEADIYYKLGTVYRDLSIYNTAVRYYHIAAQKYTLDENLGKTQRNRYRSMIYEGICLERMGRDDDSHKKAESMVAALQKDEDLIKKDYSELTSDLQFLYDSVFGQTRVNVIK